jgi:hypothetical protein
VRRNAIAEDTVSQASKTIVIPASQRTHRRRDKRGRKPTLMKRSSNHDRVPPTMAHLDPIVNIEKVPAKLVVRSREPLCYSDQEEHHVRTR